MTTIHLLDLHEKQKEIVRACIDPSIFYVVAVIGRRFGKTTMAENLAIHWAISDPKSVVYWVSPTNENVRDVFNEIIGAIWESGCVKSKNASSHEIILVNGSKIIFKSAEAENTLRGGRATYMIVDEAAFIKESTYKEILSPMLAVGGKKCLFITTPRGKNYIYEYFLNGQTRPKWKSFRYSTSESPFASKEYLEEQKLSMSIESYKQEYEAEFVDKASVFGNFHELMCLQQLENPSHNSQYYAGIDVGLINDATVLSIVDSNGNLVKYYRWVGVDTPQLIQNIIDVNLKWRFKRILIEGNNQGLPIYQTLRQRMDNIEQFTTTQKSKLEIINDLVYAFNTKAIKLPIDEYLRIELEAFIFKNSSTGTTRFQSDSGFHDDCVMSLAIAYHCYNVKQVEWFVPSRR